jgi:hypothetical protein
MVECCRVLVVRDGESVVHATMVIADRIDWHLAFYQDETGSSRIKEYHLPVRRSGQMPTTDDVGIEARAFDDVTHG